MNNLFDLTSGWTGIIGPFTLKINNAAVNISGYSIKLELTSEGVSKEGLGTVTIDPDQVGHIGQLSYAPDVTDFVYNTTTKSMRQSYQIHWKATDGSGKVVYFPNGEPDEIGVYKA